MDALAEKNGNGQESWASFETDKGINPPLHPH